MHLTVGRMPWWLFAHYIRHEYSCVRVIWVCVLCVGGVFIWIRLLSLSFRNWRSQVEKSDYARTHEYSYGHRMHCTLAMPRVYTLRTWDPLPTGGNLTFGSEDFRLRLNRISKSVIIEFVKWMRLHIRHSKAVKPCQTCGSRPLIVGPLDAASPVRRTTHHFWSFNHDYYADVAVFLLCGVS